MKMTNAQTFKGLLALGVLSALVACGGGGSSGDGGGSTVVNPNPVPVPTPSFTAAQLQGRWVTATGIDPQQVALVLPTAPGSDGMTLWGLSSDFKVARLAMGTTGVDGITAQGKQWRVGQTGSQALSYAGSANLVQDTMTLNNALQFNRTDDLTGSSQLSDTAGVWAARFGSSAVAVNWTVSADGTLSGPGTTGCTYAGQLSPRTDVKMYQASLVETCSTSTQSFSGVATYRAAAGSTPAALTLVVVSTDTAEASALAVLLGKN